MFRTLTSANISYYDYEGDGDIGYWPGWDSLVYVENEMNYSSDEGYGEEEDLIRDMSTSIMTIGGDDLLYDLKL